MVVCQACRAGCTSRGRCQGARSESCAGSGLGEGGWFARASVQPAVEVVSRARRRRAGRRLRESAPRAEGSAVFEVADGECGEGVVPVEVIGGDRIEDGDLGTT